MSTPTDDSRLQSWLPDRETNDTKRMLNIAHYACGLWDDEFFSCDHLWKYGASGVRAVAWDGETPLFALVNRKGEVIEDDDGMVPRIAFTPSEIYQFTGVNPFYLPGCSADPKSARAAFPEDLKPLIAVLKRRLSSKQRARASVKQV